MKKYPFVTSFADWVFPHMNLPASWQAAQIPPPDEALMRSDTLRHRDVSCRVTKHIDSTSDASFVPKHQADWYHTHDMQWYGLTARCFYDEPPEIESPWNGLLLPSDLHAYFDKRHFMIARKGGKWVVHVFCSKAVQPFARLYHYVELQPLRGIAPQLIFAWFAWAIIPCVEYSRKYQARIITKLGDPFGLICSTSMEEHQLAALFLSTGNATYRRKIKACFEAGDS
ncbi:MAG: hypothetical protein M1829_000209 [Trizodia sp. TS-e1964]|nr:MAG: hypothetical protein M1829_000209 [Trizodia sp. TS-e1964]